MGYLLNTDEQVKEMLESLSLNSLDDLYGHFDKDLLLDELPIPCALGEIDIQRAFDNYAKKNTQFEHIYRGAGAYNHYIPAVVPEMANKERFKTNYTPYQAEVSQGALQAIFEFQTMICELTGMDVANASVYDAASATAEAANMCRDKRKKKMRTLISGGVNPRIVNTVKTYSWAVNAPMDVLPQTKDGLFDVEAFLNDTQEDVASIVVQQPNFYGLIEDMPAIVAAAKEKKIKVIAVVNPIAANVLESMGVCGVDIAVGEGQPLGLPLAFGGPYLGFMACTKAMLRNLPGRIVGQTVDEDGKRSFVLTMQAREQHIRRETASSNVCSNQALCALAASVYMASMGPQGLKDVAMLSYNKAHYLAQELEKIGFNPRYDTDFFHEFATKSPIDTTTLMNHLEKNGVLGGLPIENNGVLWCATEMNAKEDIDLLINLIKEVL